MGNKCFVLKESKKFIKCLHFRNVILQFSAIKWYNKSLIHVELCHEMLLKEEDMKRVIARILIIAMLVTMFIVPTTTASAEEKVTKSRAIYVVFDNSGSMYGPGNKAWSQATYAMEVFAAMMNFENGDVMKVFPMHNITTTGESGAVSSMTITSQADIAKIHNMYTPQPKGTPYTQANIAANELTNLLNSNQKDEGWLIVLTDGDFDSDVPNNLREDLYKKASARQNLFVQYLAVGQEVSNVPTGDESVGFYAQKAGSSSEVVNELAIICNRIFKRNEYKAFEVGKEIEFDIPIGKVIVFAQGKDVKINSLKNKEGGDVKLLESVKVSYSTTEGAGKTSYVTATPTKDTSLKGEVAIFADTSAIVAGKYSLDVSGADSIKVYYEPDVKFGLGLFDGEEQVLKESIEGGNYTLYVGFVESLTGKFIMDSKLLGEPKYSLKINGEDVSISGGKTAQTMDLAVSGDVLNIEAGVTYLDNYTDSAALAFKVCTLELDAKAPTSMKLKSLEEKENAILVTATKNGQPLTQEQWEAAEVQIKATDEEGNVFPIEWDIKLGDTVSTWVISPKYKDGDLFKTGTGKMKASVDVAANIDGTVYGSAEEVDINVTDDRNVIDYLKRYWKEFLLSLLLLILILGYIPPFKKYFSRKMKKRPSIDCSAEKIGIHDMLVKGTFQRDIISTLIPYKAETGRLTFSPAPVKKSAKLRATGGSGMVILNTNAFAGKDNITFNGMSIPENYKGNYRISASTIINVLTPEFTYECIPNVQKSADGSIKRSKRKR